jgi:hypothetical protein
VTLFDLPEPEEENCGKCGHGLFRWHGIKGCSFPDCTCKPLRDVKASARARDEGMAHAEASAQITDEWKQLVLRTIKYVAERREYLSSIDVIEELAKTGNEPPPGSRVMGPLMRRAVTLGYIEGPVETRRSDRVSHHRGLENVWKSRLA